VSASAADYDGDGDIDIYIVKRYAANKLFKNDGSGYFTESAQSAGIAFNHKSNSAVWADMDNDGDLDLIISVSNTTSDPNPILHCYKNNGNGTFQDISSTVNISMDGYSPLVGDFDHDGDLDIITTAEKNLGGLYRNNGNWAFTKVNNSGAEIFAGDVRGGTVFDYDGDGDLDVYVVRNNVFNVLKQNNRSGSNHFLKMEARGPNGSAIGYGSKLWLYAAGQLGHAAGLIGYREILSGTGHISQYSPEQHFGLANRTSYDLLTQFSDGTLFAYRNGAVDQKIVIEPQRPSIPGGTPATIIVFSGQDQIDTVARQLPLPLVVRVLDEGGQPVADVPVEFSVLKGEATLIVPPPSAEGALWMEAELGGLAGAMRWAYDVTCSNDGFALLTPLRQNTGYDTLTAEIVQPATYQMWIRVLNSGNTGTLFYSINSGAKQSVSVGNLNDWQWMKLSLNGGISLNSGSHKILLETSMPSLQLDKILLTADAQYIPTGLGDENSSDPLNSDREGKVQRYLLLGSTAGPIVVQARLYVNGQSHTAFFTVTAKPGPAVTMIESGGNHQTGLPDVPLSEPFVVTLHDAYENPTPDIPVIFTVQSGGGTLNPANGQVSTDSLGQARAVLTPGRSSALQRVTAEASQVTGSPVLFEAIVPGIAARINYLDGNFQADTVYAVLSKAINFSITAENGDPVPGYMATARALDGGRIALTPAVGSDSVVQVYSGQNGSAQIYWRLGPRAGAQTLRIEAPGLTGSPMIFTANAVATEPYRIFAVDGDGQIDTVATTMAKPFCVRVTDRHGNPRSGLTVFYRVIRGNGSFDGATQYSTLTDAQGDARALFTLGTQSGENVYEVQASCTHNGSSLMGSPVSFWASAQAGAPRFIFVVSGDQQTGVVGSVLADPLTVAVRDFYQNIVVGGQVHFSVVKGNGLVAGGSERWIATDSSGLAYVYFQLGTQAGLNMHEVIAEIDGLQYEQAWFRASATPDQAARLTYISGDGQAAVVQTQLSEPLCVAVWDQFENSISNHRVLFEVLSPTGSFSGERVQDVFTDPEGQACVFLTLGSEVGDSLYIVRASAKDQYQVQSLAGSPLLFYASGLHTYPVRLWPITSPSETLIGTVGRELSEPIQVRVVDEVGYGVPGIAVHFDIVTGGGQFLPDSVIQLTVLSDTDGSASARWLLGTDGQIQQMRISSLYESQHLSNSPIQYNAIAVQSEAHTIRLIGGGGQTGTVGQALADSISLKVVDDLDAAVAGHPIQIKVKNGGGGLGAARDTLVLRYSDSSGQAHIQWHLGPVAGDIIQSLEIISRNGQGDHLQGSPLTVYAEALPSTPFISRSSLTAQSPVAANGSDSSNVVANIRDQYGNPVPDLSVRLLLSGLSATVEPLQGQTDAQGVFQAVARSGQAGDLVVRLQNVATGSDLTPSVTIRFLSLQADSLRMVSGDQQTAQVGQSLGDPIVVQVADVFGDPVMEADVRFVFFLGSGEMTPLSGPPQIPPTDIVVKSDAEGKTGVMVKLGIRSGSGIIQAYLPSLPDEQVFFYFTALSAEPAALMYLAGDQQTGTEGHRLGQPLSVQLIDAFANAVAGKTIGFNTRDGGYFTPAANATTDSLGMARAFWYLGMQVGDQQARAAYAEFEYAFSATALENQAPELSLPDSVEIDENRMWSLQVTAADVENDSISIRAEHLPDGAQFGADGVLAWTPSYDQGGRYEIIFIAEDHLGATRTKKLIVRVVNVNRPPKIDVAASQPPSGHVLVLKKPASLDFRVVVQDPDGDSLGYVWLVNNVLRAVGSAQYRFNSEWMSAGNASVKVIVSDRQDTTSLTWRLQIITLVTLAEFSASAKPFKGIVLNWRTAFERDNIGFYVLRAEGETRPYVSVSPFIESNDDGVYQYVDTDIKAGALYYYRLQHLSRDGTRQEHQTVQATLPIPSGADILSAYPNPFNAHTVISYSSPQPAQLRVEIFDLLGKRVKEINNGLIQAGYHRFRWDGRDASGNAVASGVYHCRIKAGDEQRSCKLILIK
ncbi:Ig-like domain-containing protein, partial [candidate division KSB1 bacterium]|nr:Ig-like domain-containing protein [candidate division KSB1 bacterium]